MRHETINRQRRRMCARFGHLWTKFLTRSVWCVRCNLRRIRATGEPT